MSWTKLGMIYKVISPHSLLMTHASNPLPLHLNDDVYRIFYSGRDKFNKSSVSFVDIDICTLKVVNENIDPLIKYGEEHSFYSHGISIGNIYSGTEKSQYILFMAWQIRANKHWKGEIGRLELIDSERLTLNPNGPFMINDEVDPISLSYPFVIYHEGVYKMWYGSTINWESENGEMIHVIKYATSLDGENWVKHGVAIPYEIGIAQAFSRPTVIIDENGYHMWFSYRDGTGRKYRIGYAKSEDGINWVNHLDKVGINVSNDGWDSEMICYPFVFDHKGERFMLYNGNDYGRDGFGLAKQTK